jgi:hypothetical protein
VRALKTLVIEEPDSMLVKLVTMDHLRLRGPEWSFEAERPYWTASSSAKTCVGTNL